MWMFPVDVMYEIVSRVPVKCLMRLRSVSKQFCGLIDSSEFIKFHMNRSKETNSNSSIVTRSGSKLYMISMDSQYNAVEIDNPLNRPVVIIDSCNGLLALYEPYDQNRVLVNLSTKKYQILPRLPITLSYEKYVQLAVHGFGYDAASGDFKLVSVVECFLQKHYDIFVYSLKTNSWKIIKDFPFPFGCFQSGSCGAFAGGALNWAAWLEEPYMQFIIAFDLKNENFFAVHLPDHESYFHFNFSLFGGSLAITWRHCGHLYGVYDIWVMKEYGIQESWTKIFSFKPKVFCFCNAVKPLAYSKCGNKVLLRQNMYNHCWFDLEKQSAEELQIHGLPLFGIDYIYSESLVSLDIATGEGDKEESIHMS